MPASCSKGGNNIKQLDKKYLVNITNWEGRDNDCPLFDMPHILWMGSVEPQLTIKQNLNRKK